MKSFLITLFMITAVLLSAEIKSLKETSEISTAFFNISFSSEIHTYLGKTMPYRIFVPGNSAQQRLPVLLFLHGAGERGTDNMIHLVNGPLKIMEFLIRKKFPCIILAPQCPADHRWVETDWSLDTHEMPAEMSWPLASAVNLLDSVIRKYQADSSRIYLTGLSMGGFGTWDLLQRMPEKFCAALPLCGGGDESRIAAASEVPVWAFHGRLDTTVKPERSRNMVKALEQNNGKIRYTEYPEAGHNVWFQTYTSTEVLLWLFTQERQ